MRRDRATLFFIIAIGVGIWAFIHIRAVSEEEEEERKRGAPEEVTGDYQENEVQCFTVTGSPSADGEYCEPTKSDCSYRRSQQARTLAGVQISSCTAATEAWCFTLMGPDGDTLARCQATPGSCNDARVKAAPVHNNVSDHCSSVASVRYAMPRQSSSTADAYPR